MAEIGRREFMKDLVLTGAGMATGCMLEPPVSRAAPGFMVAELIHLGCNVQKMPGEGRGGVVPVNIKDPAIAEAIERYYLYSDHVRFDDVVWHRVSEHFRRCGVNTIVLDLGDSIVYPSHPEIAIRGAWTVDRLRTELARLRTMGFEPIPKLNFSTGHNAWMGDWRKMVSSRPYYDFCADLIRDVMEIFDRPRYFHIGADEEAIPDKTSKRGYIVVRQGDQWYHDLNRLVGEIERQGARAWMWSDAFWSHPDEFVRKVPRTVVQSNWYYYEFADEEIAKYDPDSRKRFAEVRDAYLGLDKAGYDQVPCSSNFYDGRRTMEDTAVYARRHLAASRMKGLMMASWYAMEPVTEPRLRAGADQLAAAMRIWRGFGS